MDNLDNIFKKSELIMKYLRNELSFEENEELTHWLSESENNKLFFEKITNQEFLNQELIKFPALDKDKAWEKIVNATECENISRIPIYKIIFKYAAILVFLLLSVGVVYKFTQTHKKQDIVFSKKQDVAPGGNKATLTLADGTTILLDDADNGELARQSNIVITKTRDGQIIYDLSEGANSDFGNSSKVAINTISTPAGGQYQLILPDETKVFLNSMSSLKFPAIFEENKRNVILTGEAYFEVAKDKSKPFVVNVNDLDVEVLGTQFNIMAYTDESHVKTTLVEGSVKVNKGGANRVLIPGKQALTNAEDKIEVINADIEEVTAWKNGYFKFNKQDLKSIMRQLSRWYNIDVIYEGNIPNDEFVGKISRNTNISEVLKTLELSNVKYKIEGKKIIINH